MGASVYPHAIIGLRVPYSTVFEKATVKAFEHNHPPEWKRDPISGRELWREEWVETPRFKTDDMNETKFQHYYVVHMNDQRPNGFCYIVLATAEGGDGCERGGGSRAGLPSEDDIHAFIDALKTANLWNPAEFGLWADSYCSY